MSHHHRYRPPLAALAALLFAAATSLVAQNASPPVLPAAGCRAARRPVPAGDRRRPTRRSSARCRCAGRRWTPSSCNWAGGPAARSSGPRRCPPPKATPSPCRPCRRARPSSPWRRCSTLSGIAVSPLGDKFLKVVPVGQARTEAPEMIDGLHARSPAERAGRHQAVPARVSCASANSRTRSRRCSTRTWAGPCSSRRPTPC